MLQKSHTAHHMPFKRYLPTCPIIVTIGGRGGSTVMSSGHGFGSRLSRIALSFSAIISSITIDVMSELSSGGNKTGQ